MRTGSAARFRADLAEVVRRSLSAILGEAAASVAVNNLAGGEGLKDPKVLEERTYSVQERRWF